MFLSNFSIDQARWLRDDERVFLQARLRADQGGSAIDHKITGRDIIEVLQDPKVWLGSLMCLGVIVPGYSYAYFSPTICAACEGWMFSSFWPASAFVEGV